MSLWEYNPSTGTKTPVGGCPTDSQNQVTTFTSSDVADGSATAWTSVSKLDSGEQHKSIFAKVSQMFKNIRFLYKMLGTTDISAIGGGTVTGAISALNTSFANFLGERVVNGSEQTATTGTSGNIAVGISSSYIVLAAEAEGYYAYPFKNNGGWYIKICNYETLAPIARTSVTYRIAYKKIV